MNFSRAMITAPSTLDQGSSTCSKLYTTLRYYWNLECELLLTRPLDSAIHSWLFQQDCIDFYRQHFYSPRAGVLRIKCVHGVWHTEVTGYSVNVLLVQKMEYVYKPVLYLERCTFLRNKYVNILFTLTSTTLICHKNSLTAVPQMDLFLSSTFSDQFCCVLHDM